ncbi:hypothetical protein BdWA1_001922 [Babesia duncani]|uniref:Uncharacterized protein n=1 Tax=Babesia duncani TaxID=323732 RepID=A0AAD9UP27_9APIC|nr:hypothetical protein BdWA1_001922 [Babesia duncani]
MAFSDSIDILTSPFPKCAKELETRVHEHFLKYLDYFCIFSLRLQGGIERIEPRTAHTLVKMLDACMASVTDEVLNMKNDLEKRLLRTSWKMIYDEFLHCMNLKYNVPPSKYFHVHSRAKYPNLEEFESCENLLRREPQGLMYIFNRSALFKDASESDHNLSVVCASPFLCNSYTPSRGPRAHEKIIVNEEDVIEAFEANCHVYNSTEYPLGSFLREKANRKYSPENGDIPPIEMDKAESCCISKLVFAIIETIISGKETPRSIEFDAMVLLLKELFQSSSSQCSNSVINGNYTRVDTNNREFFSSEFCHFIQREYDENAHFLQKLEPFPSCYWLVDKHLNAFVSQKEVDGDVKRFQMHIDLLKRKLETESKMALNKLLEILYPHISIILTRIALVHPVILEFLYLCLVNSQSFYSSLNLQDKVEVSNVIEDNRNDSCGNKGCFHMIFWMLNVLRTRGVGATRSFLHVKCLHAHVAFNLVQESILGEIVLKDDRDAFGID